MIDPIGWLSRRGALSTFAVAAVVLSTISPPALRAQQTTAGPAIVVGGSVGGFMRTLPTSSYFATLEVFYDGDYRAALGQFLSEGRGALKNGPNRWIDSICYHTMAGECLYQLGQHGAALDHYTSALQLFVAYNNWMLRVQFETALRPAGSGSVKLVPWGVPKRAFRLASYKDTHLISQGQINNNAAVFRGGVVQTPMLLPVNVQEIVRTTALAIRRRRELMGPVGIHDPLQNEIVAVLSRRPGQPNHWSEAWIDLQLGVAYFAVGKDAQAKAVLERALLAGGQYDHPLTSTALMELGRLAFAQGDFTGGARYFEEATYAAVNYYDPNVLEESFRLGFMNHLASGAKTMYPPLALAETWAKREDSRQLAVSLAVMTAENACTLGETKLALNWIGEAQIAVGRRDLAISKLGARLNFIHALARYQQGNMAAGDTALTLAMNFQRTGSIWLFHAQLLDRLLTSSSATLSPRVAMDVYTILLRDPAPADWLIDPLETLSIQAIPHPQSYENWFTVAVSRKEYERALEISDMARRHRFYSSQEFGGRLLNLRWLLEGPPELLNQQATLERQDLLLHYPGYEQLSQQVQKIRGELKQLPLVPGDAEQSRKQITKLGELAATSAAQEVILREMALRREPCSLVFPPFRSTKDIQGALKPGEALLAFFCTTLQTHAFLMTNDKYGYWPIAAPRSVEKQIVTLLRDWGNYEQNKELRLADLTQDAWKKPGTEILELLMKESKVQLPYGFKELVIVPDNVLWYVPFEALQVADEAGRKENLIAKLRIRYAPTVGLSVSDGRPRKPGGNLAVVLGRLYPNTGPEVMQTAFVDLEKRLPGAVAVSGKLSVSSAVYASLFERMLVLSDITPAETPYAWSPVPLDQGTPGSTLASWLALPWGGPDQIVLPGYHTSAENSLKHSAAGNDLFLPLCGLMSTGARTVLLSRWRVGGQSSVELVREFFQELPNTTASDAWQRSVMLVSEQPIDPTSEPRINSAGLDEPPKATHPFFWAGFLLADTGAIAQTEDADPATILKSRSAPVVGEAASEKPAAPPPGNDAPPPGKK